MNIYISLINFKMMNIDIRYHFWYDTFPELHISFWYDEQNKFRSQTMVEVVYPLVSHLKITLFDENALQKWQDSHFYHQDSHRQYFCVWWQWIIFQKLRMKTDAAKHILKPNHELGPFLSKIYSSPVLARKARLMSLENN